MAAIPERELRPTMQVAFGVLIGLWLFAITFGVVAMALGLL